MSLLEFIETRRSSRSFIDKSLNDEDLIKILNAGRLAPSGGNLQRWEFIYIEDPSVLKMVKNCSPGFYGNAAGAIVIGYEESGKEFGRTRYNRIVGFGGHAMESPDRGRVDLHGCNGGTNVYPITPKQDNRIRSHNSRVVISR